MTQMNHVDIARFEFDFDTTWSAFFTDADLNIYSRYGGRDENNADSRMSKASLCRTMQEVLEVHPRRLAASDEVLRELLHPGPAKKTVPEDMPLLRANHEGCLHCHQVREYTLLQTTRDQTFNRRTLFVFPLPENLGIRMEKDHGHRVAEVQAESAAAKAGVKAGDVVTRVNDVPVHSEYDVRWALHRAPDEAPLRFAIERPTAGGDPERLQLELEPTGNWRTTELSWRRSLRSVPLQLGMLAYGRGPEERAKAGLPPDTMAIRVVSVRGDGLSNTLGLQKEDLIIELGGRNVERTFEEFKSDLLRLYVPGDTVEVMVLRDGERQRLRGEFPAWQTRETAVP